MRYELTDDEWAAITLLLPATLMGNPNSSGSGDFVHGLYVENNLPFRRQQSAFQHHVRISRIREREDCTYAGF